MAEPVTRHDAGGVFASIEEIIEDARRGRMFVLVDDEHRENEGDLVVPAEAATADAINFMARHGRGLICLALTHERARELHLEPMQRRNSSRFATAFTVSIEAKEGITTGISAADRAATIRTAIDPACGADDIATPGHVFPIVARDGGVLVRAGHTEAAVDIARLAGMLPAGVICEVMNEDGTMARRSQLVGYCRRHDLKIGTIADLIAYRHRKDRSIERQAETAMETRHAGRFRLILYDDTTDGAEHIALIKGEIDGDTPALVRVHRLDLLVDVFGDVNGRRDGVLHDAMAAIDEAGAGVLLLIGSARHHAIGERFAPGGRGGGNALREIGIGSQILRDIGVRAMTLLSNVEHAYVGLDGFGLRVVGRQPIPRRHG